MPGRATDWIGSMRVRTSWRGGYWGLADLDDIVRPVGGRFKQRAGGAARAHGKANHIRHRDPRVGHLARRRVEPHTDSLSAVTRIKNVHSQTPRLDRARENVPGDHIQMTVIEIRYLDVYEITGGVHDSRADDKGGHEHNRRGHSRLLDAAEPGRERAEAEARTRRFGGPDGSAFMGRYFMCGADAAYSIISLGRHEDEATAVNGREGDGRHSG
ncbi:hypothetical protein EDB85DRAFT_2275203 [Lactarius pseudohatsudake]|nr:hypothetical protein EDB85DRAFT_2275203 [Lactarius pseudohatsudake]